MSNLLKTGFQGFTSFNAEPYVIDVNSRTIKTEKDTGKIIRPLEEKNDEEQNDTGETANKVILDDALDMAKTLREDARIQAAKILSDAEKDAEEIRETARKEGYQQGLEEGNMEAMKRADVYLENIHKEQEIVIQEARQQMEEELACSQNQMIDISCMLIEKLTGILVDEYRPVMLHIINNTLSDADTSKKFIIKVSEENYAYVLDNHDRLVGAGNPNISIEIYGDTKLDNRQCIIESDNGIVDLSMDVQIKNLITAIKLMSEQ